MSATQQELLNAVFRWMHAVSGVLWVGHIYFFSLVQAHVATKWSQEAKLNVSPLLLPRAHFWLRWGAVVTAVTGLLLLGVVYQVGGLMIDYDTHQHEASATIAGLLALFIPFFLYDVLWRSKLREKPRAGAAVSLLLLTALTYGLSLTMSARSLYVHLGAAMSMVMALNVWLRIWPAQRRVLTEMKASAETTIAATEAAALVGERSRHNLYLTVPVTFFMVSNHFPSVYTHGQGPLFALLATVLGFAAARMLLRKSQSESVTSF